MTATCYSMLAISAFALVLRYPPINSKFAFGATALLPALVIVASIAAIGFALAKCWIPFTAACIVVVVIVANYMPYRFATTQQPSGASVPIRLLTANLRLGTADPAALVELADAHADVLVVQELTQTQLKGMQIAGIDSRYPFRKVYPAARSSGIGVWSRYPLERARILHEYTLPFIAAAIRVPGAADLVELVVVHVANMLSRSVEIWRRDLTLLAGEMNALAGTSEGCVIVAGDFNSTVDMRDFRRLRAHGYEDAAKQLGAGYLRTFPADSSIPPLIGIDHILIRGCYAESISTIRVAGSDHLGLLSRLRARAAPA